MNVYPSSLDLTGECDAAALDALAALGWRALVLWECGLRDGEELAARLQAFLGPVRFPSFPASAEEGGRRRWRSGRAG